MFSLLDVTVKVIDKNIKNKVKGEIIQEINKIYENAIVSIEYIPATIIFSRVLYKVPKIENLNIVNRGDSLVVYTLFYDNNLTWLKISNEVGKILPGSSTDIKFRVYISERESKEANYIDYLTTDIRIVVIGGLEKIIPIKIDFIKTCFGCDFNDLVKIDIPIASLFGTIKENSEKIKSSQEIPKELENIIKYIKNSTENIENLFKTITNIEEIEYIRRSLDENIVFNRALSTTSLVKVLLELLESTPNPIVSPKIIDACINEFPGMQIIPIKSTLIQKLDKLHCNCFFQIIDLLIHLYNKCKTLIDQLVEEFMYAILHVKRLQKNEILDSRRKSFFKLLIIG